MKEYDRPPSGSMKDVVKCHTIHVTITRRYIEDHQDEILLWYNLWNYRFAYAYYDFRTDVRHYYLVPFNLIVMIGRFLYQWIWWKLGVKLDEYTQGRIYERAYKQGHDDGKVRGAADILS